MSGLQSALLVGLLFGALLTGLSLAARGDRRARIGIATLVMVLGTTNPAFAAQKLLNANPDCQVKPNWCWAAATQSIIAYQKGVKPLQCNVYKWGKNLPDCSTDYAGTIDGDVGRALQAAGMSNIGYVVAQGISYPDVISEIDYGRPFLARVGWKSTGGSTGHMLVMRGYNNDGTNKLVRYGYIRLCADSTLSREQAHSYVLDNSSWSWSHTRRMMKA